MADWPRPVMVALSLVYTMLGLGTGVALWPGRLGAQVAFGVAVGFSLTVVLRMALTYHDLLAKRAVEAAETAATAPRRV